MVRAPDPVIYVAGHRGMVGSALVRRLTTLGYTNLLTASHAELDLLDQAAVDRFFARQRIDQIYLAAARVGGIHANNTYPADFIYQNLMIEANLIHAAHRHGVQRLLRPPAHGRGGPAHWPPGAHQRALCHRQDRRHQAVRELQPSAWPRLPQRHADQSLRSRRQLPSGELPCHPWPREFLHVDDMAAACVHVMALDPAVYQAHTRPMLSHINVGTGQDVTIRELAQTIARVTGFGGELVFDPGKPDGTPRKLLDVSRLKALGWEATIELEAGLRDAYAWYQEQANASLFPGLCRSLRGQGGTWKMGAFLIHGK